MSTLLEQRGLIYDAVLARLQEVVPSAAAAQVFWAYPNHSAPERPYVQLRMTDAVRPIGHDEDSYDETAEMMTTFGLRTFVVELQVVQKPLSGADITAGEFPSLSIAEFMRSALLRNDVREDLCGDGLALMSTAGLIDLNALFAEDFEDRAAFETEWGYFEVSSPVAIPRIDTVEIDSTINGDTDTILVEANP